MPSLPLVGQDFAGYRLRGVLGRGGMSVVYEAENARLGNTVALKVLAPELSTDDTFRARFLKESRLAASLNHPNVIPIYDTGPCEDLLYIAMRYVAGSDLRTVLDKQGRIAPDQALLLVGQAGARARRRAPPRTRAPRRQARERPHRTWIRRRSRPRLSLATSASPSTRSHAAG